MTEESMQVFAAESTWKAAFFDTAGTRARLAGGSVPFLKTKTVATFSPGLAGGGRGSFIDALLQHRTDTGTKFFGTLAVAAVVEHKWRAFGRRKFFKDALFYLLSLAMVVAASFTAGGVDYPAERFESSSGRAVAGMLGVVGLCSARELWDELPVLASGGPGEAAAYLREVMTWLRLLQLGLSIATVATFFAGGAEFVRLLAYTVFIKWFGLYYFMQPLPKVGPVVFMIVSIFQDILDILAAMLVAILAYGNTVLTLSNDAASIYSGNASRYDGFADWRAALYTSYKAMVLVDVAELVEDQDEAFYSLTRIILTVSSALTSIVLLNLLIARMSDSYERIQEVAEMEERRLKAKITVRFEMMMSSRTLADPGWFPNFVVALLPGDRNQGTVQKASWAGVLNEVNSKMEAKVDGLKAEVNAKMDGLKAEVNTKMEEANAKMDGLKAEVKTNMTEMFTKMDAILALLQRPSTGVAERAKDDAGFGFGDL
jgi:hypothetical protein